MPSYPGWVLRRTSIATGATSTIVSSGLGFLTGQLALGGDGNLYMTTSYGGGAPGVLQVNLSTDAVSTYVAASAFPAPSGDTAEYTEGSITADSGDLWVTANLITVSHGTNVGWGLYEIPTGTSSPSATLVDAYGSEVGQYALVSAGSYLYADAKSYGGSVLVDQISKATGALLLSAGSGDTGNQDGVGMNAWFGSVASLAFDGTNVWVADVTNGSVRKIAPGSPLPSGQSPTANQTVSATPGDVSTFAGSGSSTPSSGYGRSAGLAGPSGDVAVNGSLYVMDRGSSSSSIRAINLATGRVSTLAGSAAGGCTDSTNPAAVSFQGYGLATDGVALYSLCLSSGSGWLVRRTVIATGATSTIASELSFLTGSLTLGGDGNLYMSTSYGGGAPGVIEANLSTDAVSTYVPASSFPAPSGQTAAYVEGAIAADSSDLWVTAELMSVSNGNYDGWGLYEIPTGTSSPSATLVDTYTSKVGLNALVSAGAYLYADSIASASDPVVVQINKSTGASALSAGNPSANSGNGVGSAAGFYSLTGLASDGASLWVVDAGNRIVRQDVGAPQGAALTSANLEGGGNPAQPCSCQAHAATNKGERPVNDQTGDFWHTFTDLSVPGYGQALDFTRTYNSDPAALAVSGSFGPGWSFSYGMSLSLSGSTATITQENGSQVSFTDSGGIFTSTQPETEATLVSGPGSGYTFTRRGSQTYTFNSSGQLTSESDPNGDTTTITYPSGSQMVITDPAGRTLTATLSGGLITSLTDSAGRTVTYGYNDAYGDLTDVIDPDGGHWQFVYNSSHQMLMMRAPNYYTTGTLPSPPSSCSATPPADWTAQVYDTSGRTICQWDPTGAKTTYNYTAIAGATQVTDPDGNVTVDYFNNGLLTAETTGYGTSAAATTLLADNPTAGGVSEVTDPNGNLTQTFYDQNGNVITSVNPLGQVTTYAYNSLDEPTCSTLPLAATGCDGLSPPAPITAGTTTITPPTSIPPPFVTFSQYDTDGNLIWTTTGIYPPGSTTASYARTTYTLYNGQSVTIAGIVDSCTNTAPSPSLPCATINPDGVVTQIGYDSGGDVTSTSTPDGNPGGETAATTSTYNRIGEKASQTAPDGNLSGANAANYTTTWTYNGLGQPLTATQAGGTGATVTARTTSYGYDPDGNLTSTTRAGTDTTTVAYDPDDRPTLSTDPDGHQTLTCYDGDSNTTQTVPPVGVAAGALTASSCPTSYPSGYGTRLATDATTWTYNTQNRKTAVTTPAPAGHIGYETTTYAYDPAGRLTSITAPPNANSGGTNQVTQYTYNTAGQTLTVAAGYGTTTASITSYCYDPDADETASVAPDGNTSGVAACSTSSPWQTTSNYQTGYQYDSNGELVNQTRPATAWATSGQTTTYSYDPAGNQLTSTDPNGVTATTTYTPLDQPANLTYSASTAHSVAYSYDPDGNRTQMVDGTGTTTYNYDPFSELTSTTNGASQTIDYTYDSRGNTTSITYPLGAAATWAATDTVNYSYDPASELSGITDLNGNTTTVTDTADGLPSAVTLGTSGDTIDTTYDPTDAPSTTDLNQGATTLLGYSYSDAPSGTILAETDTPTSSLTPADYTYDSQSRVTSMTPGSVSPLNYGYDASGNPTTLPTGAAGTYNYASELTAAALTGTTTNYTYDADGNRTQTSQTGTTLTSATYNGADQLVAYNNPAADMTAATYNGDGLRTTTTTTPTGGSATTTNYLWDPTTPIECDHLIWPHLGPF
jgi:YD repeat-containing protein